jgi:hypothetical protein
MKHSWLSPDRLTEKQKALCNKARVKFGPIYPITRYENDFIEYDFRGMTKRSMPDNGLREYAGKKVMAFFFLAEDGSSHVIFEDDKA